MGAVNPLTALVVDSCPLQSLSSPCDGRLCRRFQVVSKCVFPHSKNGLEISRLETHTKVAETSAVCLTVLRLLRDRKCPRQEGSRSRTFAHFTFSVASMYSSKRRFLTLSLDLHEKLPLAAIKISHSSSNIFSGSIYDETDARRILTEFEVNGECNEEESCDETSDGLKEILDDDVSYLVLSGVRNQKSSVWRKLAEQAQLVSIPDNIEELGTYCFRDCDKLLRVTFGESSSLKLIGADGFLLASVREIHIPDSVEKLVAGCFRHCYHLSRVTFGESSSLKRIGMCAFDSSGVIEIHIPDSVEELADECFLGCHSLSCVTFGRSSALKKIGCSAFRQSTLSSFSLPASVTSIGASSFSECRLKDFVIYDVNAFFTVFARLLLSKDKRICYGIIGKVKDLTIPDFVEELCGECFYRCFRLSHVTFGESSSLKRIGTDTFTDSGLIDIHIPDGVEEISDKCFFRCRNLERVTFGASSSLKRIGKDAFSASGLEEIHIPDGVETLSDSCLDLCRNLPRVTFGESSLLKVIGIQAFCKSGLVEMHIPDGVENLPKQCFIGCASLSHVTFGVSSSLKRIGDEAFARSGLIEIHIPDGVEELCKKCFFRCESLSRVTFGESSLLKVIGKKAFCQSSLKEIHIPDGVEVLCDRCRELQAQTMH